MLNTNKKQHNIALVMLSLTAIVWGAGFVLNSQLLNEFFYHTPILFNAFRFGISSLLMLAIFAKQIRWDKQSILYSTVGGVFLFAAFSLQVFGLKYTTPAHSGFFTAAYIVFTPFVVWAMQKKAPSFVTIGGVALAIVGLAILNLGNITEGSWSDTLLGDLITLVSALMFALQIVWSEISLKKGVNHITFTTQQLCVASVLFVIATLIFENQSFNTVTFDIGYGWWRFALVILLGTVFAYYSQTFAQQNLSSGETALIMGCESPIGAVISILVGMDQFSWNIVVGGVLVVVAVLIVELVPTLKKPTTSQPDETANDQQ